MVGMSCVSVRRNPVLSLLSRDDRTGAAPASRQTTPRCRSADALPAARRPYPETPGIHGPRSGRDLPLVNSDALPMPWPGGDRTSGVAIGGSRPRGHIVLRRARRRRASRTGAQEQRDVQACPAASPTVAPGAP